MGEKQTDESALSTKNREKYLHLHKRNDRRMEKISDQFYYLYYSTNNMKAVTLRMINSWNK